MAFCHAWCNEVDAARTHFVYSDEGLVGEYDAAGQEIRTYGWIPDSGWSTDPLFVKIEGVYYWYRNDHLGTPQKIITTSGAIVWEAVYDSFGNCQILVETITNNLRFPGQYFDSETGLCYNLNRYYDPTTGRYLRADPFGPGLNLYVYCFNNPLGFIDPMGLCAVRFVGGMVKGAASAAFQMFVYQPLAMVYDLEQIAYSLISGDLGSFTPYSDIGLAAVNGAGTTDILVGMAKGIGYVPLEFVQAIASGDPERIGAATFNAGLLAYGAYKAIGGIRGAVEARLGSTSESVGNAAHNAADAVRLNKSLASQAQMGEVGEIMAGSGGHVPFRDAGRIVKEYGGTPADWVKKTSSSYTARDGVQFETHWVENIKTGQRVEFKTKFRGGN